MRMRSGWKRHSAWVALALLVANQARGGEVLVACSANFAAPMQRLADLFRARSGHEVKISTGSTGTLYAKIIHGAPYEVFLAADRARPQRLETQGRTVADTRFTYAIGRLVLWSPERGRVDPHGHVLRQGDFHRLAIANPKTAPYGRAARQTLEALGLWQRLAPRLVRGENIAQAFTYVRSGNAQLGFVAASQLTRPRVPAGSRWPVPARYHDPIAQQAVLLKRGAGKPAARQLVRFLSSEPAQRLIEQSGYRVPDDRTSRDEAPG